MEQKTRVCKAIVELEQKNYALAKHDRHLNRQITQLQNYSRHWKAELRFVCKTAANTGT